MKIIIYLLILTFTFGRQSTSTDQKLMPSEALALTYHAINSNLDKDRLPAIRHLMPRTITSGLNKQEQFYLGEMYFWNLLPEPADKAYEALLKETDYIGRAAWQRWLQVQFRGFGQHDLVEKKVKEYRQIFKADPKDTRGLFGQTFNLSNHYKDKEDHNRVIELIDEELNSLDYQGAYRSYILPAIFAQSYIKANEKEKAIRLLTAAKDGLSKTLEERRKNMPEKDNTYVVHTSRVLRMHTVVTEELGYAQMNKKFVDLIKSIDDSLKRFQ